MFETHHICIDCGYVDTPKKKTSGSFLLEITVWIIMIVIGLASTMWILLLALGFSLFRAASTKNVCRSCLSGNIIPVDSPNGKELIAKRSKS